MIEWRPMRADNVPLVSAIAQKVHPDFFEDDAIFAERQRLAPEGSWLLDSSAGALGYVLSHPWTLKSPPALNTPLNVLPATPDSFYIHDLALLPEARGTGAAGKIVKILIETAKTYPTMSLVAVNGSRPFWSRFGFEKAERPDLATKLSSYSRDAVMMVRNSG